MSEKKKLDTTDRVLRGIGGTIALGMGLITRSPGMGDIRDGAIEVGVKMLIEAYTGEEQEEVKKD